MNSYKFLAGLLIFSLVCGPLYAEDQGEENPLVADTFSKKKKTDHFAPYNTVLINHLNSAEFEAEAGLAVTIQKIAAESTGSSPIAFSIDNSGTNLIVGGAVRYGLTDNFNLESDLTYSNGKTETTTTTSGSSSDSSDKISGIQDLKLRAQYSVGFDSFGYSADVTFIPSIGKASSNAGTEESNAYREQSSLGIQNYLIFGNTNTKWGGLLGFVYNFNGEVESIAVNGTSSTKEVSGGNTLTGGGFVEFSNYFNTYLQLSYVKGNDITKTTASGVATDFPGRDYLSLIGAMKFNFTKKISFVPQVQYITILNRDADPTYSYTQVDIFGLSGTVRFLF